LGKGMDLEYKNILKMDSDGFVGIEWFSKKEN